MSARNLVESAVKDNKCVVFSKSYCPFASKAKRAISAEADMAKVLVLELDQRDDGAAIQAALGELTGGTTVPRVFIAGKFVGGGDETVALQRSGQLRKLLTDAGAV